MVLLEAGKFLVNPTDQELAGAAGVPARSITDARIYDLVVVGAGPGGLAASVYGAAGGFSTCLIDAVAVGGQASTSGRIENYLGFPAGVSGAELAERSLLQAEKFAARYRFHPARLGSANATGFTSSPLRVARSS